MAQLSDAPRVLSLLPRLVLVGRAAAPAADFLQQTGAEIMHFAKGLTPGYAFGAGTLAASI